MANSTSVCALPSTFTLHKLSSSELVDRIRNEYAMAQALVDPRKFTFTTSSRCAHKNRYVDVLASEETLFPPVVAPPKRQLYVNGNRLDLGLPHTFIASQAPVPSGIEDYLVTLCEHSIDLIVMLTRVVEGQIVKADRYWPADDCDGGGGGGQHIEKWSDRVQTRKDPDDSYSFDEATGVVLRPFWIVQLRDNGGVEKEHKVVQVQFTAWPDFGVPKQTAPFEALLDRIRRHPTASPILVHCSAGIGRTGTLIGAYAAVAAAEAGTLTDHTVYDALQAMRRARRGMVQTVAQYAFIYKTLFHHLGLDVETLTQFVDSLEEQQLRAANRNGRR